MALIECIDADEPGFDAGGSLASLHIEPVVYECGDERTLALELVNRTDAQLGVDFELREFDRHSEPTRPAIAKVAKAGPDTGRFIRSGLVGSHATLLRSARARFALGTNVLRVPARDRVVVHTEPFARTLLEAAAAKAKRAIGMYLVLTVIVVSARAARILAKTPLVCLPKDWEQRPRPSDAIVLSPALLLDRAGVEREAALARSRRFDDDELLRERVAPTVEALRVNELLQELRAKRSSYQAELIDGLEIGFPLDDDRLQPSHERALDELTRFLDRIPFEPEDLVLEIEGAADGVCTSDSRLRAESLALRRAESVRSGLASLRSAVEIRVRTCVTDAGGCSISLRSREQRNWRAPERAAPMFGFPWPGVPNSYSLAAEFPLLSRLWKLDALTLPRLRAIYKESTTLAAALVPERVRGKPVSSRREREWLEELHEELAETKSRSTIPIPAPHEVDQFVWAFGLSMTRFVGLLIIVREYALTPEDLHERCSEWGLRVLTVLVDEWQPESQRGWAARLERLRAIDNQTDLVPALVIAIAEQCATLDILITGQRELARGEEGYQPGIERARRFGLDELASEDTRATWLARHQHFRAAVDRPDLPDLLAEYDDHLERVLQGARAELG